MNGNTFISSTCSLQAGPAIEFMSVSRSSGVNLVWNMGGRGSGLKNVDFSRQISEKFQLFSGNFTNKFRFFQAKIGHDSPCPKSAYPRMDAPEQVNPKKSIIIALCSNFAFSQFSISKQHSLPFLTFIPITQLHWCSRWLRSLDFFIPKRWDDLPSRIYARVKDLN